MAATAPPVTRIPSGTVLARLGEQTITAADVDAALARASGEVRSEYTSPAAMKELVRSLVDRKLMAAAARVAGIDKDAAVQRQILAARAASIPEEVALADAWLARQLGKVPARPEAEVTQYYRDHPEVFTEPKRVFVTRVVAASVEAAEELRQTLAQGATPEALREKHRAAVRSVDQLWLQDGPAVPELTATALALEPGAVSPIVTVSTGPAVLRVEQKKAGRLRPLAEVRAGINATLDQQFVEAATAAAVRKLRKEGSVTLDEVAIDYYSTSFNRAASGPSQFNLPRDKH